MYFDHILYFIYFLKKISTDKLLGLHHSTILHQINLRLKMLSSFDTQSIKPNPSDKAYLIDPI